MPKIILNKKKDETGLPVYDGKPEFLSIGILRNHHGVRGEMKMEVWTDFPERIKKSREVFIGEEKKKFIVQSFRQIKYGYLIHFMNMQTLEDTQDLQNKVVYVKVQDNPPLKKHRYYYHQILGLDVFTVEGDRLGKISEIIRTGSNDVYVVENVDKNEQETLYPAISSVIVKVDLKNRKIVINPPQWE